MYSDEAYESDAACSLNVTHDAYGWRVTDTSGQVWRPDADAAAEIAAASDSAAKALAICRDQPMRGRWQT